MELYPGAAVASSVMTPIPTEWWLRPDSNAAVGVAHGPPNALDAAKPTSSSRTTSTFGEPAGGCSGSIAGNEASGSLASSGSSPSYGLSGIGRTSRWTSSDALLIGSLLGRWADSDPARAPAFKRGCRHAAAGPAGTNAVASAVNPGGRLPLLASHD